MNRIMQLRKEKNWTQEALSMKLNVSQKMISAYENGIHDPSIETLINMSHIFNVSVDYIIGNSNLRIRSDQLLTNSLTESEIRCLEVFKSLSHNKQLISLEIMAAFKVLQSRDNDNPLISSI